MDHREVARAEAKRIGHSLPRHPSAKDALLLIAGLGGHRKCNGPPGWQTLTRGIEYLQGLVNGWTLRERTM